jgi:hypothetical protein
VTAGLSTGYQLSSFSPSGAHTGIVSPLRGIGQ